MVDAESDQAVLSAVNNIVVRSMKLSRDCTLVFPHHTCNERDCSKRNHAIDQGKAKNFPYCLKWHCAGSFANINLRNGMDALDCVIGAFWKLDDPVRQMDLLY